MSQLPTNVKALRSWQIFADDIAEFFDRYIDAPVILGGHSFGAASGIIASEQIKDKLAGYVGLDPVTMPFLPRLFSQLPGGRAVMKRYLPIARGAGRRRFVFDSKTAAFERYKGRGAFKGMPDATLDDYLEGGLKDHPEGLQLCCHPLWEQAIFAAQGSGLFKHLKHLPANSQIVYGGKGSVSTNRLRSKVARLMSGEVAYYREFHHLFPFHEPDFTAGLFRSALAKAKF
jgi:pimeloyl-ACP methyl ester carboxylesterase